MVEFMIRQEEALPVTPGAYSGEVVEIGERERPARRAIQEPPGFLAAAGVAEL